MHLWHYLNVLRESKKINYYKNAKMSMSALKKKDNHGIKLM